MMFSVVRLYVLISGVVLSASERLECISALYIIPAFSAPLRFAAPLSSPAFWVAPRHHRLAAASHETDDRKEMDT